MKAGQAKVLALSLALVGMARWYFAGFEEREGEGVSALPVRVVAEAGAETGLTEVGAEPSDDLVDQGGEGGEEEVPDLGWVEESREIDFAKIDGFGEWSERWVRADLDERKLLEAEGMVLARERREEFKQLIRQDPELALKKSVARVIRQDLPEGIVAELEKPVSAKGELRVYGARPADEVEVPKDQLVLRYFEAGGETYRARVYGDLRVVPSRQVVPLWGVAVDGEMAVAENAVRPLEVGERITAGTLVEETCPVSGKTTEAVSGGEAVTEATPTVEIAGNLVTLCDGSHVKVLEEDFRTWIQANGSGGAGYFMDRFPGTSSRSIGNLRCLYIRVTYPDQMVAPNTEEEAYGDMKDVARFYLDSSYGKMTTTTTVTPVVVLPQTLAWYKAKDTKTGGTIDCLGLIHNDSRAAAKKLGYDPGQYDCIIVRINKGPRLEGISWGGGSSVWITWGGMVVLNHECGHSLGRNHANYWNTTDGTAYGEGSNEEYGNPFDVMGGGGGGFWAHYNTISKLALGWLNDDFVHRPATSGVYRLYAYDQPRLEEGKKYGLTVAKDSIRNYHVEYHPAAGGLLKDSALVLYSGMGSNSGHLLDTTPGSSGGKNDSGIAVGRTYSDDEADIHFTVVSKNATEPPSLDVAYYRGPFPGNRVPVVNLQASATSVAVGGSVTLTANAVDADGDVLAYYWEFSDGTTAENQPVVTKIFSSAAQVTAMVTVSDMKGGVARSHVLLSAGSHGKQSITGTVSVGGQPLSGVRISNGSQWAYTNDDGRYAIAGVGTGTQTLTAALNGYVFQPLFSNPLTVVAGSNVADWTVEEGVFVRLEQGVTAVEGGAKGSFTLSRTGDTSSALVVKLSPMRGTATKTSDYVFSPADEADGSYRRFTIPAGQASLTVNVEAAADGSVEGTETILLQLASNGAYLSRRGNVLELEIQDRDTVLPVVAVSSPDPDGNESPADTIKFVFTRRGSTLSALSVPVAWSGTATAGLDYEALPATVTIPAGQSAAEVVVTPVNDAEIEGPETVVATLSSSASLIRHSTQNSYQATIVDDDTPVVEVSVPDAEASEIGPDSGLFLLTRSGSVDRSLKVYYGVYGTALHGTDYRMLTGEVTIPAGERSAPVLIEPYRDNEGEMQETVTLVLSTFQHGYSVGVVSHGTVYLNDAGDLPTVSVRTGVTGAEGGASPTFLFRAVGGVDGGQVTVHYRMTGTATAGSDYVAPSGTVTIPTGGSMDVTVSVSLIQDTVAEPTETLGVEIVDEVLSYRVLNGRRAEARILDDESGGERVMVSVFNESPAEPSTGGTFYFSRVGTSGDLTVAYSVGGSATAGADFGGLTGTVVIPDGSSGVDVPMSVIDDTQVEGVETVTVEVLAGSGYGVDLPSRATYEIADDEKAAVNVGFRSSILRTTEQAVSGSEYRDLEVLLSSASASPVRVMYRAAGGTATGDDVDWSFVDASEGNVPLSWGQLDFAPGETSKWIRVRIKNDGITEPIESAIVELGSPVGASLTGGRSRLAILIADETMDEVVTEERWSDSSVYTNQTWDAKSFDMVGVLRSFTPEQGVGDSYSRRLSGWITAPETGAYVFWVASDDASRLYLSTDDQPANKVQIARVSGYTSFQSWDTNASQKSVNLSLVAGRRYYLEVQHQEGSGNDHVSVAWQGPGFSRKVLEFAEPESVDLPRVRLARAESVKREDEGGEPELMVVLDRPAGSAGVVVSYGISGTASPGVDYQGSGGRVTLSAGEWLKSIPLSFIDDGEGEAPEAIVIDLLSATGAVVQQPDRQVIRLLDAKSPVVNSEWLTVTSVQSSGQVLKGLTVQLAAGRSVSSWNLISGNSGGAFEVDGVGQLKLVRPSVLPNAGVVRLLVRVVDNEGSAGDGVVTVMCNAPTQAVIEQRWSGSRAYQDGLWSGTPSYRGRLASLTTEQNVGDSYSRRLMAFLRPAVSGDYTFWIAGDDACRLYLSPNDEATKAVEIASVADWTRYQVWDTVSSQKSAVMSLVAGKVYWMEVHQMEASGGDHVSVAWQGPGISRQAIPSSVIFPVLAGMDKPQALSAPSVVFVAPSEVELGDEVTLEAVVVAGSDGVSQVDFYDGDHLLGSDATSPYTCAWAPTGIGDHPLRARLVYDGGGLNSQVRTIVVNGMNPAADADGDGFPNGLEQLLGTSPTSETSQPPSIYSGLRAWWRLDEVGGAVADDSTGRAQDGTVEGALWGDGIDGGGVQMDGVDDGILVGDAAALLGAGSFSLSAWVKLDAGVGKVTLLQQRDASLAGDQGNYLLNVNENGTVHFSLCETESDRFDLTTALAVNDGSWHHVAAVREGSRGRIYLDGVEAASGDGAGKILQSRGVSLGYDLRDLNHYLKGSLDDVRIYERALSSAEVRDLRRAFQSNRAPAFSAGKIPGAGATEDVLYEGSLAGMVHDPDLGDSGVFLKVSGPDWLEVKVRGGLGGVPENSDVGTSVFVVRVTDADGESAEAELSIEVSGVNDAPMFARSSLEGEDAVEHAAYEGTIAGTASDIDAGDLLVYSKVSGPSWLSVASDGRLSGTPGSGDVGASIFQVRVSDAAGESDESSLRIVVENVNDEPQFTVSLFRGEQATEDIVYEASLVGLASDPDADDVLSFQKISGADWLHVAEDGKLSGLPSNHDVGLHEFVVRVSDMMGAWAEMTLMVEVQNVNDLPVFLVDPMVLSGAREGEAYEGRALGGLAMDADAGDVLSYSKVSGAGWLVVGQDGVLSGVPARGEAGLNVFVVRVTDSQGASDEAELRIDVEGEELPLPWKSGEVGVGGLAGGEVYLDDSWSLRGCGAIRSTQDRFRWVYQTLSGDGSIVVRVAEMESTDDSARVGLMIRESLASNSRNVFLGVTSGGGYRWSRRNVTGGPTSTNPSGKGQVPNVWLKLARTGSLLTASKSADGVRWTPIGSVEVALSADVFMGMVVAGGSENERLRATFDRISVDP